MEITRNKDSISVALPPIFRGISSFASLNDAERELKEFKLDLILDFSETTLIDSTAVGKLISLSKEMSLFEKKIKLTNCAPDLKEFFVKLKIDRLFDIK